MACQFPVAVRLSGFYLLYTVFLTLLTMLQVTTGAIANLSTRISQLWYICQWAIIILSGSILYMLP